MGQISPTDPSYTHCPMLDPVHTAPICSASYGLAGMGAECILGQPEWVLHTTYILGSGYKGQSDAWHVGQLRLWDRVMGALQAVFLTPVQ